MNEFRGTGRPQRNHPHSPRHIPCRQQMIALTFQPLHGESQVRVRGLHFRICEDATLRGPDNAVAARYSKGFWLLGHGHHRAFECDGPVYLRVTSRDGSRHHLGPYEFVKAAEGAIYSRDGCLGHHATRPSTAISLEVWREVALLSDAPSG